MSKSHIYKITFTPRGLVVIRTTTTSTTSTSTSTTSTTSTSTSTTSTSTTLSTSTSSTSTSTTSTSTSTTSTTSTSTSTTLAGGVEVPSAFFACVPDTNKGAYASIQLTDTVDIPVYQTFIIPSTIASITTAAVVVIPDASGDLYWSCSTNFGELCNDKSYQEHTDSIASNPRTVTLNEIECIDITGALTVATGGDIVGILFTRQASDALDTIGDIVHYLGVLIIGDTA